MFKNYFKIAYRNLIRHKVFSTINITGLAIGIASCLLLFTVVKYELSYDTFQPDYKNIYHVVTQDTDSEGVDYTPGIPFPALNALRLDFPDVTTGVLCANFGSQVSVMGENANNNAVAPDKKFIVESGFFFCDPDFFKVFNYTWLSGSPELLKEPNVTVLSRKTAEKYFGEWKNAIGKFLKLDNLITVKVVGVLENTPANTDIPLEVVSSYETLKSSNGVYFYSEEWGATSSNFQLFMKLPPSRSESSMNSELLALSNKYYSNDRQVKRINFLQPLGEMHFDNRFSVFGDHVTERSTLWTLSLIGIFIIVMACINFINLSTAQSVSRSKEIGVRKVLGGYRWQLFRQVMAETFLIVFISVILGLGIAAVFLPWINHIVYIPEPLSLFTLSNFLFLLGVLVLVTLLAGVYPSMIVSGFKPALALKNKITSASVGGLSVRRGLVIFQFAISQVLIIGTMVAISQMSFVKNADLGFNKDALLVLNANMDSSAQSRQVFFKQKLLQVPGVKKVTFSSDVPSSDNNSATNFGFDHKPEPNFNLFIKFGDEDYFDAFGLQFLAGTGFSASDTIKEVVVNETLVKKLGVANAEAMIGKDIMYGGRGKWKKVVGVVKDFKTNSLKEDVKPLAIASSRNRYGMMAVKMNSSNLANTKAAIENAWNQSFPEYAFTSNFLDENIARFYQQDTQLSLLYKIFAIIAIVISCLGLYGLVSFMAVQKTKEIGVRKVLGASMKNIIFLFSKEFTLLIIIGSLMAIPIAYYMMNEWLQNFVYRIRLTPFVFIIAILISLFIAWIAVGYKSVKAALADPVKSLRSE